ncbi:MAG: mRNA-degrading endonuclease [Candidatus Liptonbacteria bacterium RIFCSPLOWO2_01_FULL_45_15]|uniref:mRNA-degrading endonuclease n=1 Tax=Candidatus Liptonbacteria bacterium RIFCSPLOWO2_01_FULL_45_15 TaxID=1798649 RepID=A0A1G2CFZ6_9BACT|nr:MAG: mRNA-degrading endonuclease [Candidatus Liptonbacteria bacterium RIFCSPLOWO2_01_FULL_45_15]
MVKDEYIPKRGDIVWIDLFGTLGHEQSGRRPALIISPVEYNKKIGLVLACPITSISKRYPHEARIAETKIKGVVLSDQVRSIDWKARKAEFAESVPSTVIDDVEAKLLTLIQS